MATFTGDIWSVWTSPARFDHRDVVPMALTVGAFALGTRFAIGRQIATRQLERRSAPATGRSASTGAAATRARGTRIVVPLVTLSF